MKIDFSRAAAPSRFRWLCGYGGPKPKPAILYNRPMDDTTIPLTLYHPAFGQFVEDCDSFKPGSQEHAFARNLSTMAGHFNSATQRRDFFNLVFAEYYKFHLAVEDIPGTNRPTDGHAYVNKPELPYIFVITQGRNEITKNATDPRFESIL